LSFVAKLQRAREVLEQQGRLSVRALVLVLGIGRSPRRLSAAVWTDDRDALAPVESGR
jgi:hypothetical protein